MQLLKKFIDGLLAKLSEIAAAAIVAALAGVAWFSFPQHVTVSRWALVVPTAAAATLVHVAYLWGVRRGKRRIGAPVRFAPIDTLQESILKLLWAHPHACVKFEVLVRMLN